MSTHKAISVVKVDPSVIKYCMDNGLEKQLRFYYRLKSMYRNGAILDKTIIYKNHFSDTTYKTFKKRFDELLSLGWVLDSNKCYRLVNTGCLPLSDKIKSSNRWISSKILKGWYAMRTILINDILTKQKALSVANHLNKNGEKQSEYYKLTDVGLKGYQGNAKAELSLSRKGAAALLGKRSNQTGGRSIVKSGFTKTHRFVECKFGLSFKPERVKRFGLRKLEWITNEIKRQSIFLNKRQREAEVKKVSDPIDFRLNYILFNDLF